MDTAPYLTIQSLVHENRESMPMGLATDLMNECQKAHTSQPKLYKLTWTVVNANAQVHFEEDDTCAVVQLSHKTQTLIVEAVDERPLDRFGHHMNTVDMPDHGLMYTGWIDMELPSVIGQDDKMIIIHSIVSYDPYKRARV